MNRIFALLAFFLISFIVYGFYLSQFQFKLVAPAKKPSMLFYDYRLSQNIHTNLSLGSGTYSSIAEESKRVLNHFTLFTDVNPSYDLDDDRYINGTGLLFGAKLISPEEDRHIIYSLTKPNFMEKPGDIKDFQRTDSLLIAAHPLKKDYETEKLLANKVDGLEVVNLKSITQATWEKSKLSTIWSMLYYPFNPRLALIRLFSEPIDELKVFDTISKTKKFNFYLGTEASARAIPFTDLLIKIPSYERSFSIASEHLLLTSELTGNMKLDREKIFTALKDGQFYVAFDALGDPTGFETYIYSARTLKQFYLGSTLKFSRDLKLYFKLPSEPNAFYEVVLFKDGQRIDNYNTFEGLFAINGPGVYRLQVRISPLLPLPDAIKWLTWIYTNNFYVTP